MSQDNKFQQIKGKLELAKYEIVDALKIANKTAHCCGANLDDLLREIDRSIANTQDHIDKGIDEKDLIK